MKSFTIRATVVSALALLFLLPGCTDHYEELNTPDREIVASEVDATTLGQAFARSQWAGMHAGTGVGHQIHKSLFADLYAQYFATTAPYFDSDQYIEVGDWIDSGWNNFYSSAAPQLKFVRDFTRQNDMPVRYAAANIWRVEIYQRMTDYFGPIPYSEFGNGEESVPYDSQEEIYMDFFARLDSSYQTLSNNTGGSAFGSSDLVYSGDVQQWMRFGNSLQLRAAMRIRHVMPEKAKEEAEEAVSRGVMTSNGHNAELLTTQNNRNAYGIITNWGEFRMSSSMESLLEGYNDPRKSAYFNPSASGDQDGDGSPFEGMRNGLPRSAKGTELNGAYSDMATRFLNENRGGSNPPVGVMNAAEVYFLRAEGALLGWDMGGSAEELYNEGIRMSLSEARVGASQQEIEEYVNSTATPASPSDQWNSGPMSDIPVDFQSGADMETKLEQIITQKWLALYPVSLEAFAELRRTGYPVLYPIIDSRNPNLDNDDIFRRMTFVISEFNNNTQATENAIPLIGSPEGNGGPDQNDTKVWWDVRDAPANQGLGQP
ncbi:MAG: SusD/RagB family nutrient-binding outer membrane lipoprotein [Salinibacter sp.]|uniref:SusD/RagB family nutrient-binding outer membrane lipoprotein n=1 Tax=Salinibacter sp. TaxID=2065818 RepID=UPI002FC2CD91